MQMYGENSSKEMYMLLTSINKIDQNICLQIKVTMYEAIN